MKANISIISNPPKKEWEELLKRPELDSELLDKAIADIFTAVRSGGDKALHEFTQKFDGVELKTIELSADEIKNSENLIGEGLKLAIREAAENIDKFHSAQRTSQVSIETMPGVRCWQKAVPIQRVGLYIPGGNAPLFSSVLMLAIPARIAGCKEIIMCTPPGKDGKVNPAILYAAKIAGVNTIYTVGGAQAIAAMAFGTETIRPVSKIFGPGNQYVTAAKQMVQKLGVAIDLPAGPSEVLVMADETANAHFVASDLLSQAEHGADSQVMLFATNKKIAADTISAIDSQIETLPRRNHILKSLESSKVIVLDSLELMVEMANEYAPEHLIIAMKNAESISEQIVNAGSVFLGNYTPESAGDYASGTNHTLPTNGYAKAYSGVNLDSFVKKITYQHITPEGLLKLGNTLLTMAEAECLQAHKNAVKLRIDEITKQK